MTHNATPPLLAEFLHALAERERQQDQPQALQRFRSAYQQLTESARQAERSVQDQYLQALVAGFATTPANWEFSSLAITCGAIVEFGGDPSIAVEPILDRLTVQLQRVPEFVGVMQERLGVEHPNRVEPNDWQKLGEEHPDEAWVIAEWFALGFVGGAAMTMLSRDVEARKRARERIDLMRAAQAARSDQPYAYYLAELLGMVDDERLLVLDTTRRRGYRVRLTAVRNNFHLFTLLQAELFPHEPRLSPLGVSVARSERMLSEIAASEWNDHGDRDDALCSFNAWHAMNADGSLRTSDEANVQPPWIWGEMKPSEIPMLEDERIVLLGPLDQPRSWEIAFFAPLHSALRSGVEIEELLSELQYDEWNRRIRKSASW